jgi:hypothetical protein
MSRLRFAKERYGRLREEAEKRGFDVTDFSQNFEGVDLGADYRPSENDRALIIERICQRVRESRKVWWHYYGKRVTKEEVIDRIS